MVSCRSYGSADSSAEDASGPLHETQTGQQGQQSVPQQHYEHLQAPSSEPSSQQAAHQQGESASSDPQQSARAHHSPEQQLLLTAIRKLHALETYQHLLSHDKDSSREVQRRPGDTPAEVSAKIAADRDEVPLLDAAILIAQVCLASARLGSGPCRIMHQDRVL